MASDGNIEKQIRVLLKRNPDMPRTEMAQLLGVSRKTLYKHLGRMEEAEKAAATAAQMRRESGKPESKVGKPPPGPNKGSFTKGDKRAGAPPGNTNAVTTGEYRNPLLHGVTPERIALVESARDQNPSEMLRESIALWRLSVADMTQEIEAISRSKTRWWWLGSTYKRQEGDGELMGTGRISERRRVPREEALRTMIEARARVQAKLDMALVKLADMEKPGGSNGEGAGGGANIQVIFNIPEGTRVELD